MEDDRRPQLTVQGVRGTITGEVARKVCDGCPLRDSDLAIVSCDGYPTKEKPAEVFKERMEDGLTYQSKHYVLLN